MFIVSKPRAAWSGGGVPCYIDVFFYFEMLQLYRVKPLVILSWAWGDESDAARWVKFSAVSLYTDRKRAVKLGGEKPAHWTPFPMPGSALHQCNRETCRYFMVPVVRAAWTMWQEPFKLTFYSKLNIQKKTVKIFRTYFFLELRYCPYNGLYKMG